MNFFAFTAFIKISMEVHKKCLENTIFVILLLESFVLSVWSVEENQEKEVIQNE